MLTSPNRLRTRVKNSVRRVAVKTRTLLGHRLDPAHRRPAVMTGISQAEIAEENLQVCETRDWRQHFAEQLEGKGLEIGPLHRPMVRHDAMDIDYIDRYCTADLRAHYPELNDLPLVESDIIGDAETLEGIADDRYDFLISSHVIEHMKNPLGSLEQWCRVVKPGGRIFLAAPDKRVTFDSKRVRTTLPHLILDYHRPSAERDYEHYLDFATQVHNKVNQEAIDDADHLAETDYSIHFHVFLPTDVLNLLTWFSENIRPITILEGPVMSPGDIEFHFLLEVA